MTEPLRVPIEIYDSRMRDLIDPEVTLILLDSSSEHSEGPVYIPAEDQVVWSDVIGNRVLSWQAGQVSILREPSHFQNGNALDLEGRIVACSHGDRAIIRRDFDGEWRILVDVYQGNDLNSPNDLVVKSDGSIWFTDPPFGLTQPDQGYGGEQDLPGSYVFRFDPITGDLRPVITEMMRPNGLVFSPDEKILYVSDSSAFEDPQLYHNIRAYDILEDQVAVQGRTFATVDPGQPDGLCVDAQGHVFASSQDSIQIYAPDGTRLGKIFMPEICTNLTFGGKNGNQLWITADRSLYTLELCTRGPMLPYPVSFGGG